MGESSQQPIACLGLLLVGLGLLAGSAAAAEREARVDLSEWIDGPVRYIALKPEVRAFKALETDEARALYIEKFWARRDPSPETLRNEYRQLFWERVQQANTNFLDSPRPGWMTDRGKVHILYGPPTEVHEDLHLSAGGSPTAGQGVIRWIYEGRPASRRDLDAVVVVPFERDVSGEYRLSYEPKLASVFFDATAIREKRDAAFERFVELTASPTHSRLSVMLDLGRMQEIPPQEKVLLERVETLEAYQTIPLQVKADRFFYPDERSALVVVSVDLAPLGASPKPAILARFTPLDATRETRLLGEDSFRIEEHGDYRVAQARIALEPGSYSLTVIVADPVQVQTGVHRARVEVPRPSPTLSLSDPVWAFELEPLDYAALASHDEPFLVGPFRVLPKLESVYRRGDAIKLFFEVYGAEYPLRVSYQLEGKDENGAWVRLGRPSVSEQLGAAQAWELPTTPRWPLGDYRVRVEVQDSGERLVTTDVPFTLRAADAS